MPELLLEIGLEEIPARMIAAAEAELARRVEGVLTRSRLLDAAAVVTSYSTPRRLAVRVEGVLARQLDYAGTAYRPFLESSLSLMDSLARRPRPSPKKPASRSRRSKKSLRPKVNTLLPPCSGQARALKRF